MKTFNSPSRLTSTVIGPVLLVNKTGAGLQTTGQYGEAIAFGAPIALHNDGLWYNANSSVFFTPLRATGLALATGILGTAGAPILLQGFARNDAWTWTPGQALYLGASGSISNTPPGNPGDIIQVIGWAGVNARTVFFSPSLDFLIHP